MIARAIASCVALVLVGCASAPSPAARPAPASVGVSREPLEGRGLLADDAARAAAAGAGPLAVIATELASEGDRVGAFLDLPAGECVLVIARGSPGVADVDLAAFEDDGATFASDESSDPQPALLLCPPLPKRLYAAARVASGVGLVAVGAFPVPPTAADAVRASIRAHGKGDDAARITGWPGIEATIAEQRAALGGRWEDVKRAVLPVDARVASRASLPVGEGRCLHVLVAPSEEVASLEVVAEDAGGRVVARAKERGRDRVLVLCSRTAGEVTVAVRARASQGFALVVGARSRVGAEAELAESVGIDRVTTTLELAAARRAHADAVKAADLAAPTTVGTGTARVGVRDSFPVELPAGCARLDVVAGRPLAGTTADLWDERGAHLASARGGPVATLHACGPGGKARVDVEAVAEPGPFAVELRRARVAPPALVAHPLAASRVLARLEAGRVSPGGIGAAADAKVVALDESSRVTLPLPLTPGTCTEVVAAIGPGGSGLDLRLLDGVSSAATVARARNVVSDRVCAPAAGTPGPRVGSIEVGLASGKAEALIVVRDAKE
jgi:hypothetical protein